jgi:glucosamine--fructose-6-phosphate aminotransferase (isomerizing)
MGMRDELLEQSAVAARLIVEEGAAIVAIAAIIRDYAPDYVVIAARGTSDHAAIYAQYVLGARHRLPIALSTPSLLSLYGVAPRFARALVIGISQSGASPDVVGVVAAARGQGALTIAITNDPQSSLAITAEHVIDLGAGPERAVAATKTYTAELVAIAALSAALAPDPAAAAALTRLPEALARATGAEPEAERIAPTTHR